MPNQILRLSARVGSIADLCQQTSAVIGHDVSIADHKVVHGWRYANIKKQSGRTYLIDEAEKIGVCGDWLIKGRVESAFSSGYALVNKVLANLTLQKSREYFT